MKRGICILVAGIALWAGLPAHAARTGTCGACAPGRPARVAHSFRLHHGSLRLRSCAAGDSTCHAGPGHAGFDRVRCVVYGHLGVRARYLGGQSGGALADGAALASTRSCRASTPGPRTRPSLQEGIQEAALPTVVGVFDVVGEGEGGAPIVESRPCLRRRFRPASPSISCGTTTWSVDPRAPTSSRQGVSHQHPGALLPDLAAGSQELLARPPRRRRSRPAQFVFTHQPAVAAREPMKGRARTPRVGYFSVPFDDYGTDELAG